jgi:hypothetical protein
MTLVELMRLETTRVHRALDGMLEGLTPEQLHAVPGGLPTANTIAWGLWHVVRTEDNVVRFVLQNRRPPVWTEGGYGERLGLPPVAQGTGMPTAEAQALRIRDVALFREYMGKVWASTDEFLASAPAAFWDTKVTVKPLGEMEAARALAQICVAHSFTHFGEMELARLLAGAKSTASV